MILTRENMEIYQNIERELERIDRKLDYYAQHPLSVCHGVVRGSCSEFPFQQRRFTVTAPEGRYQEERDYKIRGLLRELATKKRQYEEVRLEIDIAIEQISDMEMRQIFQYKYMDGMSNAKIGAVLGYDRTTITKKLERFFEQQSIAEREGEIPSQSPPGPSCLGRSDSGRGSTEPSFGGCPSFFGLPE